MEFRDVGVVETWKLPRCFCLTTKYHEISHIKQISRIYLKSICVGFLQFWVQIDIFHHVRRDESWKDVPSELQP